MNNSQYVGLDLNNQPLLNAVINPKTNTERLALALSAAEAGTLVFDTTLVSLFLWQGTSWLNLSNITGMLRENAIGFTTQRDRFGRVAAVTWRFEGGATKLDRYRYANDTATEPAEVLLDTTTTEPFLGAAITDPPPVYTNDYTIDLTPLGLTNIAHSLTFVPIGGEFDPTLRITPSVTGVTGSFGASPIDPASPTTFTATSTGAAVLSFANNKNTTVITQNMAVLHQLNAWRNFVGTNAEGGTLVLPPGVDTHAVATLNPGWTDIQFLIDTNDTSSKVNWVFAVSNTDTDVPLIRSNTYTYERLITVALAAANGVHLADYGFGADADAGGRLNTTRLIAGGYRLLSIVRSGSDLTLRSALNGAAWEILGSITGSINPVNPQYLKVLRVNNDEFNGASNNARILRFSPVVY